MTAHKHAALMLQYAQDAAETDKPWERWEVSPEAENNWRSIASGGVLWNPLFDYRRRKPDPVKTGTRTYKCLAIGGSLFFESEKYETASFNAASFEYIEHATDHWSADNETSVPIDEEMAKQIIAALTEHFWPSTGAQQERKPHTEAEVQEILGLWNKLCDREKEVRRILDVPPP